MASTDLSTEETVLRSYLFASPYPSFIFTCSPEGHKKNELELPSLAGPFDLQHSVWANSEGERSTGGRGLWRCLPPESRTVLRRKLDSFWLQEQSNNALGKKGGAAPRISMEMLMMVMVLNESGDRTAEMRKLAWSACLLEREIKGAKEKGYILTLTALMSPEDILIRLERPPRSRTSSAGSQGSTVLGTASAGGDSLRSNERAQDQPKEESASPSMALKVSQEPQAGKSLKQDKLPEMKPQTEEQIGRARRRRSLSVGPSGSIVNTMKPLAPSLGPHLPEIQKKGSSRPSSRGKDSDMKPRVVTDILGQPTPHPAISSHPSSRRSSEAHSRSESHAFGEDESPTSSSRSNGLPSEPSHDISHYLESNHTEHRLGYHEEHLKRPRPLTSQEAIVLVEMCPVALVLGGADASLIYANNIWYELCGMTREQPIDSWTENVESAHLEEFAASVKGVLLRKQRARFEFQWKNGNWTEMSFDLELDEDGEILFIIGALYDITSRKRLELLDLENHLERERFIEQMRLDSVTRELELAHAASLKKQLDKSTREMAKLANLTTVGLCSLNDKGDLEWANEAFFQIHSLERGQENMWPDTIHPEDHARVMSEWAKADAEKVSFKSRHRIKNGKTAQVMSIPFASVPGGPRTWIASVTDISAQADGERELKRLSDARVQESALQAEEAEERRRIAVAQKEQQGLLVDVVSHELRNGISPILHSAMLIRASLIDFARKAGSDGLVNQSLGDDLEACDAILDSARAMERVANDVLSLAQVQLGQLVVTPTPFSIEARLRAVARIYQADCRSKDIELSMDFGNLINVLGPETTIVTDPQRLQQLIVNLFSNAIKFVTLGGGKRKVMLTAVLSKEKPESGAPVEPPSIQADLISESCTAYLYISVTDTGPGMNKAHLTKLFQKWSQATPDVHLQSGGSGLGLYISKALVLLLQGRIDVISTPDVGSSFRFYVKVEIPQPLASREAEAAKEADEPVKAFKALKLLVCDDNVVNRKILKRQLSQQGHDVAQAENGQLALDAIAAAQASGENFDCIILDINMPVMTGLEAATIIRQEEQARREPKPLRIIGCTGNARQAQLDSAVEAGMDAVVTKPYRLPELLRLLQPIEPEQIMAEKHPRRRSTE